ncbi:hypothetical protein LQ938_01040 [Microbacterium sp. cx-55]|uniref:hypothetical protein n=1 Tax=Microbacterium sp. cx-55 TaxID=2875948 RepID=UPI001CBECA2C|nr:hypothetical protein [Microbacterium sp. cx-55]MBZ4487392.1 hypothetical protein [Microbacterium sp. cx-55]UGB35412.1 hypothetical protein LQ938_01040 [Microbacterium sp. cx-55]
MASSREDVVGEILALNGEDVPFAFAAFEGGVVGVWDYADAKWAGLLAAGQISRDYELTVTLHDDGSYSLLDETHDTQTRLDTKGLHHERSFFKGTKRTFSFNASFAPIASDHGQVGNTFGWKFDTEEMKEPVREILTRYGWIPRHRSFLDRLFGR